MTIRNVNEFGELVRQLRRRKHWSQDDLAKRTQTAARIISLVETGKMKRGPTVDSCLKIMDALGCEIVIKRKGPES